MQRTTVPHALGVCAFRNEFTNYFFLDRKVDTQQDKREWRFFPQVCLLLASVSGDTTSCSSRPWTCV